MDNPSTQEHSDTSFRGRVTFFILITSFVLFVIASIVYITTNYHTVLRKEYTVLVSKEKEDATSTLEYGPVPSFSNGDFFSQIKDDFIEQHVTFIFADLARMKIAVYENGALLKEFPILTKGKEGSWWETPAGLYKVESKSKNHFSSFGNVNTPWNLVFQGNFFIHGWPTYKDGTPVSTTYSGGCIRLSNEDAKEIYSLVTIGTPIIVFEKDFEPDNKVFSLQKPDLSSTSYLIVDLKSNFVFLEKDATSTMPLSALTNIVTALVATEFIKLDIDLPSLTKTEKIDQTSTIKTGTRYTGYQLLFPLLIESSKDAGSIFAKYLGEKRFVSLMNKKVSSLGMRSTEFVSVSQPGNTGTPYDLFLLSKYIYNNRSFIVKLSSGKAVNYAYEQPRFKGLVSPIITKDLNTFVGGIQDVTGETRSGLYIFEIPIGLEVRTIAIILGNSKNIDEDLHKSLEYVGMFR